jgi:AraC-like DNA-binding protein
MMDPDAVKQPFFVLRQAYLPSHIAAHQHRFAQLTDEGRWIVPPQRGVWIPSGKQHAVLSKKRFDFCTFYVSAALAKSVGQSCQVVQISPLLSELLLKGAAFGVDWQRSGAQERLLRVALDQIATLRAEPLHLPQAKDKRLARICDALMVDPADNKELGEWAGVVGASERTLTRIFKQDTGVGFAQWRRQCRLLHAVEMLASGRTVTQVALDVGYNDMSAFARDFKLALGASPGKYFEINSVD